MSLRRQFRACLRRGWPGARTAIILIVLALAQAADPASAQVAAAATAPSDAPAASAAAPPAADDQAVLDAITAKARLVVTVTGHYEQRTLNAGDTQPELRLGRFAIQAPDHYNLVETRSDDPNWKKRQCSDGHTQWEIEQVFPDVKPEVTTRVDGGSDGDLRRVMACVRGDLSGLAEDFTMSASASGAGDGYRLVLLPRSAPIARDVSRVVIVLDQDSHVHSLTLEQPSGTRITLTITDAVYNQPVPDQDFRYASP